VRNMGELGFFVLGFTVTLAVVCLVDAEFAVK
jgi:hypothetical protein